MNLISKMILVLSFSLAIQQSVLGQATMMNHLSLQEFEKMTAKTKQPQIIDLRPISEFNLQHLPNAIHVTAAGYNETLKGLDTAKAIFIYATSNVSLSAGIEQLKIAGFSKIYGTFKDVTSIASEDMGTNVATIASTSNTARALALDSMQVKSNGFSLDDYNKMIRKEKFLLIDFYADWCMPCQKMVPIIEEITKELKGKLLVKRLNVDNCKEVVSAMPVFPIPMLYLYKNGNLLWKNQGLIDKASLLEKIKTSR
jgi:thioredoxin